MRAAEVKKKKREEKAKERNENQEQKQRETNHEKIGRTGKGSYPNNLTRRRKKIYKAASCIG
jgi:hypothetical protein